MSRTVVVVPCYNEARRLDVAAFAAFAVEPDAPHLLFVDDGSSDATLEVLEGLRELAPESVSVLALETNGGKAEAVRRGMLAAVEHHAPEFTGFWDADLSTPLYAIDQMLDMFDARPHLDIVMASRIQLLGRRVLRNPARHYAGRVFATLASTLLRMPVYDTQCGAKLFRVRASFLDALREPFLTDWVFDVELLARLIGLRAQHGETEVEDATYEFPLHEWVDVAGSRLRAHDFPLAAVDLAKIWAAHRHELARRSR